MSEGRCLPRTGAFSDTTTVRLPHVTRRPPNLQVSPNAPAEAVCPLQVFPYLKS